MNSYLIHFPVLEDKIENLIIDKNTSEAFVKKIQMILDRIDCEKNSEIYYNKTNKQQFIIDYIALEELLGIRIGAYGLEEIINNFLQNNSVKNIKSDTIIKKEFLLAENFLNVDLFFSQNNADRILNRTDFRHCENHPQHISGKSPLINGIGGFDNAAFFLSSAIGDAKTKRNILINIDKNNSDFILRYEDENFMNQYHAYHIVKKEKNNYIFDQKKINLINNSHKGIPRAYKLILYREKLTQN